MAPEAPAQFEEGEDSLQSQMVDYHVCILEIDHITASLQGNKKDHSQPIQNYTLQDSSLLHSISVSSSVQKTISSLNSITDVL